MVNRDTLLAEKVDYERQIAAAQADARAAQDAGNVAQQRFMLASGALQAIDALLAKMPASAEPATETPAPKRRRRSAQPADGT